MANKKAKNDDSRDSTVKRLDALIRLVTEILRTADNKTFNDGSFSRILKSTGLTPTEIAQILGKKSATDISQYLYIKKKKK
jgi:hypothetical protein